MIMIESIEVLQAQLKESYTKIYQQIGKYQIGKDNLETILDDKLLTLGK